VAKLLGWASIRTTDNVGGAFRQWNAKFGADDYVATSNPADSAFETRTGQSFSVRVKWGVSGTVTNTAQNTIKVSLFYETDQEATNLGAATPLRTQTITSTADAGDQTLTFSATSTGDVGGTNRAGTYRIRVTVERTDAVAWGPLGSDGEDQNPSAATARTRNEGCSRWGIDISSDSFSNASFGGSTPNPFAYPDTIFARLSIVGGLKDITTNINAKLRYRVLQSTEKLNTLSLLLGTAGTQNIDVKIGDNGAGNDGGVDTRLLSSSSSGDWQVDVDGNAAYVPASGVIRWCHLETITPTGWATGDNEPSPGGKPRRITKVNVATFDPRVTLNTPSVPALPRMRSESSLIGAVTALQVTNARGEKIAATTNANTAARKRVTVDFSVEDSQSINPDGSNNYSWTYTPPNTSPATWDKVGTNKTLNVATNVFTTNNPINSVTNLLRVSRYFYSKQTGGLDETIFTGKTASPSSDQTTIRNRGQTLFFNGTIFNARDETLGSVAGFFGIRRPDQETYEHALAAFTLTSGVFSGSSANYIVLTAAVTSPAGRTLVFADSNAANAQPRTGTGGIGNFGETSRNTPEWTISSTYTVESRTQKTSSRTTDPEDVQFTIGEDVVYQFAQTLDASGDPISGAKLLFTQINPSGSTTQSFDNQTTGSNGWTSDPGQAFDSRAPKGTGWIQRATINSDAANNGNSGSNDQAISMVSAFTANKNLNILVFADADPTRLIRPQEKLHVCFSFHVSGILTSPDTSPAPSVAIMRHASDTDAFEYLNANGTYSQISSGSTPNFFTMTESGVQPGTWHLKFGPGESANVPLSAFTAGTYGMLVAMSYQTQLFRDDENFEIIDPGSNASFDPVGLALSGVLSQR
jgi:hypothetical protein